MGLFRRIEPTAAVRDVVRGLNLSWPGFRSIYATGSKGGAGKTTLAALTTLGLCQMRPELVGYADQNPDGSTAWARLFAPGTPVPASMLDLLAHADAVRAVSDLSQFVTRTDRLVAATNMGADRAAREAISAAEYGTVRNVLARFVQLLVVDGGTSLVDSAARSAFAGSDQMLWAVEAIPKQISDAEADLRFLLESGETDLVGRTVVGWMQTDRRMDLDALKAAGALDFFEQHCAGVVTIPYDGHLAVGGTVLLDRLQRRTRTAVEALTGAVAEQFPTFPLSWERHEGLEQWVKSAADEHDGAGLARAESALREFTANSGIRLDAVASLQRPSAGGALR